MSDRRVVGRQVHLLPLRDAGDQCLTEGGGEAGAAVECVQASEWCPPTGNTLSAALVVWVLNGGYSTVYYSVAEHGWTWFLLSWPLVFCYQVGAQPGEQLPRPGGHLVSIAVWLLSLALLTHDQIGNWARPASSP